MSVKQIKPYLNAHGGLRCGVEAEFIEIARHWRRTVVQQEKRIAQLEADKDFLLKAFRTYWRGSPKDTGSDAPNR